MKLKELADFFSPTNNINIYSFGKFEAKYLNRKEAKEKYGERIIYGVYPYDEVTVTIEVETLD